jgi:hypothetical protein
MRQRRQRKLPFVQNSSAHTLSFLAREAAYSPFAISPLSSLSGVMG